MKVNKLWKTLTASAMSLALVASVTAMPAMAATNPLVVEGNTVTITKTVNMAGAEGAGVPKATYNFTVAAYHPASLTPKEDNAKEGVLAAITNSGAVHAVFDGESASETFNLTFQPSAFAGTGAGIYYYQLTEQNSGVSGVTENTNTYILKAYVTNDGNDLKVSNAEMFALQADALATTKTDTIENQYTTYDLTVTKNVTGNMGDKQKDFTFTIVVNDPDATNHMNSITYVDPDNGQHSVSLVGGTAQVSVQMKDGESVVVKGLPEGTTYAITESDNRGYTVTYAGDATQNGDNANLATGTMATAAAHVTVSNDLTDNTPATGVILNIAPYALMVVMAVAGVAVFMRRRVEE